ncbi:hypothetical protein NDU88_000172 [Pleurodeles waltl]|uniref:Uncharacterized protein n=1 Tax=Pleurodeles waltl TaxID=8319 RepID=A0AAV7USM4_PLEWA|nr:hypothetical protein NDU88_000172 [Pleurodeles waltl]
MGDSWWMEIRKSPQMTMDFSQQSHGGRASLHKKPADWSRRNAETDAESMEGEDRNANIGTRDGEEGDGDTGAHLQEPEEGGKHSGAKETRTGEGRSAAEADAKHGGDRMTQKGAGQVALRREDARKWSSAEPAGKWQKAEDAKPQGRDNRSRTSASQASGH